MKDAQQEAVKLRKVCILLSGGSGSRMKTALPKQYLSVAGKTVLEHTLGRIRSWKGMDGVLVVADPQWHTPLEQVIRGGLPEGILFLGYADPGETRQQSILNGLRAIKDRMVENAAVMIHDAVRPEASEQLIDRCDKAFTEGADGVMPALRVKDTLYISQDGFFAEKNLDRGSLVLGQTPEIYDYRKYLGANEELSSEDLAKIQGSTQVAVGAGMKIRLVPGEEGNFKLTTMEDLERFRQIKEGR